MLYVAGEDIEADDAVVLSLVNGKLYKAGPHPGTYIGDACERLREGLRVQARPDGLYEDDG